MDSPCEEMGVWRTTKSTLVPVGMRPFVLLPCAFLLFESHHYHSTHDLTHNGWLATLWWFSSSRCLVFVSFLCGFCCAWARCSEGHPQAGTAAWGKILSCTYHTHHHTHNTTGSFAATTKSCLVTLACPLSYVSDQSGSSPTVDQDAAASTPDPLGVELPSHASDLPV